MRRVSSVRRGKVRSGQGRSDKQMFLSGSAGQANGKDLIGWVMVNTMLLFWGMGAFFPFHFIQRGCGATRIGGTQQGRSRGIKHGARGILLCMSTFIYMQLTSSWLFDVHLGVLR
jgi:hypothetical protein